MKNSPMILIQNGVSTNCQDILDNRNYLNAKLYNTIHWKSGEL